MKNLPCYDDFDLEVPHMIPKDFEGLVIEFEKVTDEYSKLKEAHENLEKEYKALKQANSGLKKKMMLFQKLSP